MKKVFSKSLALVLTASLLFSVVVGVHASAEGENSGSCGENVTWSLSDAGELVISGTGDMADYHKSTGYAPWYAQKDKVTSVVVGEGVTTVGNYAFYTCKNLGTAVIADSVTNIGASSFNSCESLRELTLPCSARIYNDELTFGGCKSIAKITVTAGTGEMKKYSEDPKDWTGFYSLEDEETYYSSTPWYVSGCAQVVVEAGVNSISSYAFYGCRNLKSLIIKNPNCKIYSNENTISSRVTIVGFTGSTAEAYATKHKREFVSMGSKESAKCEHSYTSAISAEPTCVKAGEATYTCSKCDSVYTEVVVPTGVHTPVEDKAVSPTCMTAGKTKGSHCSVCETVLEAQETIPALGHSYSKKVTTNPTCVDKGVETYTCTRDGCTSTYTKDVDPTGVHTPQIDNRVEPTCEKFGLTQGSHCTVCEEVLVKQDVIEPLGHSFTDYKSNGDATCTKDGTKTAKCDRCEATNTVTDTGSKLGHTEVSKVTKATFDANGKVDYICSVCGEKAKDSDTIAKVSTVKLAATSYEYNNGKAFTPAVTVKDSTGKALTKGKDYDVTYASGRKDAGKTYKVTVTLKGNYNGTKAPTFKIVPKTTSITKVSALKKSFKVTWKKQATQTTGYVIEYSTDKNFKKSVKKVTVKSNKTTSYTVKKLSAKKKYYVRVYTYKASTSYLSKASAVKSVTTKK